MEFDKEKLVFELMDCFSEEMWPKYNFEKLVDNSSIVGDFIVVKGSNFKACFDKDALELVNLDIWEVKQNGK